MQIQTWDWDNASNKKAIMSICLHQNLSMPCVVGQVIMVPDAGMGDMVVLSVNGKFVWNWAMNGVYRHFERLIVNAML